MIVNNPPVFDLQEYLDNLVVQNRKMGARKAYKARQCRARSLENYGPYKRPWNAALAKSWTWKGAHSAVRPITLYATVIAPPRAEEEQPSIIYAKDAAEFRTLVAAR